MLKNVLKGWDKTKTENDIAMLRTIKQMEYSEYASPACLPSKKFNVLNSKIRAEQGPVCVISGWGRTKFQRASADLMYASVRVRPVNIMQHIQI